MANYVSKYTGAEIEAILDASSKLNSTQTANYVLVAPNGSAGKPTFRKLVAADIPTIKQDGITGATINRFGTCTTAAATAAKTVSINSGTFTLEAGARVTVKFTNANTANTPTLNVESKGAQNIFHKGAKITTGANKSLLAGTVDFVYDGTQWHLVGNYIDSNTTYSNATTSANGLMSASDKDTLDNYIYRLPSSSATKNGILMGSDALNIWGSGVQINDSSQGLLGDDYVVPTGLTVKDYILNTLSEAAAELICLTDYAKPKSTSAITSTDTVKSAIGKLEKALDGKASTSVATATAAGLVKPKAVRTSAINATTGGTTSGKYYGVELDKNGSMFVNVPWSSGSYTLPEATSTTLGGVRIGDNISVNSGIISLSASNIENALGYTPLREDALETLDTDFYTFASYVEQNFLTRGAFESVLYSDGDDYILVSQAGDAPVWMLPEDVYNYSTFGAAPTSHASTGNVYGLGTTTKYGHVKISNGDVNSVASADGLVAGMDHSHGNYALATKLPTFSLSGTVLTITDNS